MTNQQIFEDMLRDLNVSFATLNTQKENGIYLDRTVALMWISFNTGIIHALNTAIEKS